MQLLMALVIVVLIIYIYINNKQITITDFIFYLLSGIRDYVHVMDLAEGHVAALKKLQSSRLHLQVTNYYDTTFNI